MQSDFSAWRNTQMKGEGGLTSSSSSNDAVEVILPSSSSSHRQSQPEHLQVTVPPKFSSEDPAALAYLEKEGFVVIAGVMNEEELKRGEELVWEFLEKFGMKREDVDSWGDKQFRQIGSCVNGIIGGGGFGQSAFQWFIRTRPSVKKIFELIYQTPDLLCSLDGGNIFRPWQTPDLLSHCTSSGWFHVDQGRTLRGRQCVQGLVSLTDATAETGGFCCIPGSHKHHDELMDTYARDDFNYFPIPNDFHGLEGTQVMPLCSAGDMILWDSRTIHCSSPALTQPSCPPTSLLRLASYICMTPAEMACDQTLHRRLEMFRLNQTGTHWPHIQNLNRLPGTEQKQPVNNLSALSPEAISLLLGLNYCHT